MTDNEKFPGGGPPGSALTAITRIVHGNLTKKKKKKEVGGECAWCGGVRVGGLELLGTTFQGLGRLRSRPTGGRLSTAQV